ncbi:MAG: succinate dehydrogenase/fumarate reductase iron-sulfur subunit [Candidatus Aminicenantes bacterium]
MEYTFRILRFDPEQDEFPRFQSFFFETTESKSVLEALMAIRNEQDGSLSFRYSCREAICGSCAMVINGNFDLACRTELQSFKSRQVIIEPLANMEIQKDLVVDMDPFWEALYKIKPYVFSDGDFPEHGYRIDDREIDRIFQYVNCIMCGSCYSACPVVSRNENYLGPASLAKLFRFVKDPRDLRCYADYAGISTQDGAWGCHTIFKCNEACPKDVRPADGIEALRRKMVVEKIKSLFRWRR